ncbi:MAG: segregation/condensation protein A [Phycisphaerales bacterium]|nr:segregation/condensation protein A [Phycisphaerales bacterium]
MLTDDYRVKLEAFEGPLDLLLFLIRKSEVEVADIPVARIADQYMAFLKQIDRIDIDAAGEFLVMAATLMEIKSRMLAFRPEGGGAGPAVESEPSEDPRAELVRQLLAYKQYRDAADTLERRRSEWERKFPTGAAAIDRDTLRGAIEQQLDGVELEEVGVFDLAEAFRRICETVNFDRLGDHQVTYDDTPIELHAEDILDRLRREAATGPGGLGLTAVFNGRTRSEMIGLFLAVLELVRRRAILVEQDSPSSEITLRARPEQMDDPAGPVPGTDSFNGITGSAENLESPGNPES